MGTPAYFIALAKEITSGYRMGRFVDERRAALVGSQAPSGMNFDVAANGDINLKVEGRPVPMPMAARRDNIKTWNDRLLSCGNVNAINAIKNELRAYLIASIEQHLIFRELSNDEQDMKQDVRDEEER